MSTKKKVVLAYSGGLDTSCAIKWLMEKGYNVVCFMADVGQGENVEKAKKLDRRVRNCYIDRCSASLRSDG